MKSSVLINEKGLGESNAALRAKVPDGNWVADVDLTSFMKADPEDCRTPRNERPLVIPVKHWAQVLGVHADEVSKYLGGERFTTQDHYGYCSHEQRVTLVSHLPFVAVHFRDHNESAGDLAKLHSGITVARQMHKGELGQRPSMIRKPQVLQSRIPDPSSGFSVTSHRKLNWVELSELVNITGLVAEDIIRGFAGFSPSTYYEPNVPLLRGNPHAENIVRVYVGDVPKSFCAGETQWGGENAVPLSSLKHMLRRKIWVTQAFAYTVIRLVQLGYRPNNETPECSFRLEASMPEVPEPKMPVLSSEELRQLHDFRLKLGNELDKETFRSIAERVLGSTDWYKRPALSDTLNGFAYYTGFETLDAFGGLLQVAVCHWTRGGQSKTPNCWAGFLSVHSERPHNARTDPAELRIWFWPDELHRCTPTGLVGGLCHGLPESHITAMVRNLVVNLGYCLDGVA